MSSPHTQPCVSILAVMPAQTFVQSDQAGMRRNWKPAHAGAITESKHSNHNLDLKINSRRGRQDSLPHISICLEKRQTRCPAREADIKKPDSKGEKDGAKLCQHSLCQEDTAMQPLTMQWASNQQLVPAGRGKTLWDQHTVFLHRQCM